LSLPYKKSLDSLQRQTQTIVADKAKSDAHAGRIAELKSSLETKVTEKTKDLIDSLLARQDKLLEAIEDLSNKKQIDNLLRLTRLEEVLRCNFEWTAFVEKSLSSKDAEYIQLDPLLSRRIDELLAIKAPSPLSEEELSVCLDLNSERVIQEIEAFGSVCEAPLHVASQADLEDHEKVERRENLEEAEVRRGFLFYFLFIVFILCHCVPVFVALSEYYL